MTNLYSLDLSFCTKLSVRGVTDLLADRRESLVELRLQNCTQLDISQDRRRFDFPGVWGDGQAGRDILNALRDDHDDSLLSVLDLRSCGGVDGTNGYPTDDPFVRGARDLRFEQRPPGFFLRPFRKNLAVEHRLVDQLMSDVVSEKK